MNTLLRPFLMACFVALAIGAAALPPAVAEDAPSPEKSKEKGTVEQLTAEELDFLRKKFPGWEKLDARRQAHIARNVIRLREMSDEERAKLKSRMDRLRKGRKGSSRKHRGAEMLRVADEVGGRVLAQLPDAVQAELTTLDARPSMIRMALFRKLKGKAAEGVGGTLDEAALAQVPENTRGRIEKMLREARASGDDKKIAGAEARVRRMLLWKKMEQMREQMVASAEGGKLGTTAYADALMRAWAEPIAQVVQEIEREPKSFVSLVRRAERDHMTPRDYQKQIWALERLATSKWRKDGEMKVAADRIVRRLLVDELKVDKAAVDALPSYEQARERRKALGKLLMASTSDGKRSGWGNRRGGKGRRGAMGNGPGKGKRGGRRGPGGGDDGK